MSEITKVTCQECQGSGDCQECKEGSHCELCDDAQKCLFCKGDGWNWELKTEPIEVFYLKVSGVVNDGIGTLTISDTNSTEITEQQSLGRDYGSVDIGPDVLDDVIIALLKVRKELNQQWKERFNEFTFREY